MVSGVIILKGVKAVGVKDSSGVGVADLNPNNVGVGV
jgi:hypothetical protein